MIGMAAVEGGWIDGCDGCRARHTGGRDSGLNQGVVVAVGVELEW